MLGFDFQKLLVMLAMLEVLDYSDVKTCLNSRQWESVPVGDIVDGERA